MENFTQNLNKITRKLILLSLLSLASVCFAFGQNLWPQEQTFSISEPENVVFSIDWGSFSEITEVVYYFWDEEEQYHEITLTEGDDYAVDDYELTIYQSYIESMELEPGDFIDLYATFNGTNDAYFGIRIIPTYYASIFEDSKDYDLSNPDKVFGTIAWAYGDEITSVKVGGNELNASNYDILGNWIFFTQNYLSTVLTSVGNSINVEITFDYDYSDNFVINAIQTGVNNPTLSPEEFEFSESEMPEYIETIITWNAASSIESMFVTFPDHDVMQEFPYGDYTVTPINASTATLRVYLGGEKSSNTKEIHYFYVSIKINFNVGSAKYIYMGIYDEYYYVDIYSTPWNGGWFTGGGDYDINEEVYLEAFPNDGYTFVKWIVDGETDVTDNPYIFNMPAHDVEIEALFMSDYPEVLYSNPIQWQSNVDVNSFIYLTFNKNIIEGTSNNGFDDITFYAESEPWTINNIYILNNNILVIEPVVPLNINTSYYLNIPPESIEDAANPGTHMSGPFGLGFTTGWGNFQHGDISPEENIYSIMEPGDVVFDIFWGDETSLDILYFYYWDQFDDYHEVELNSPGNYLIDDDQLIIKNSFISSLSPELGDEFNFYAIFESGWNAYFSIYVIQTTVPYIVPNEIAYDLSNPHDAFSVIVYNNAESVNSVSRNSTNLIEDTDYRVDGNWLFIHNSYLSPLLQNVSDEITLDVTFDTEDISELTITAIQSGIIDATIDPQFYTFTNNEEIDYLDITITWNDASSVESLTIWEIDDNEIYYWDHTDYTVTPINAETALLRIFVGAKKSSMQAKYTDQFNVMIEIEFNVGAPAYYFLTVIDEYYFVITEVYPENGGYIWADWEYSVGEDVELYAEANWGYNFSSWKIDGIIVSTENPYVFEMPANDVYITAFFVPQGADLYTVTLISDPVGGGILSGAGEYTLGNNVTINVTENTGYEFVNWTNEASEVISTSPMYSFTMLAENVTFTAHFNDVSNIDSNNTDEVDVFPNPFSDLLFISNYESLTKITITTVTGQIVAEYNTIDNGQINTSDLSKGFYMLIMQKADGENVVRKIVKQ